ncbi:MULTISPECIES: transglycosylase SLT domain-containing protein [unclassified Moraxella]|uniref:lytic transglycosylase domain-containing protein n=1 Tax=unclassified Moraxella TaxID=2685852 RepID=UPI003AF69F58
MNYPVKFSLSLVTLSCIGALTQSACAENHASIGTPTQADSYFNQAESASRSGNVANYQGLMAGGNLAMYPEYWQLNQYLDTQSPQTIINFANKYPKTAMAEKLVADYAEAKAQAGDYASVRQVAGYISNADDNEACAVALGYNQTDAVRAMTKKTDVWLEQKNKKASLCGQLATELNNNTMINNSDREQRLYRMLRGDNNGEIVQLSSRLGAGIDYNQLMQISSNPNGFFSSLATKPNTATNRYLYLYALGQLAKKSVNQASMQFNYDLGKNPQFFDEQTRRYAYRNLGVARMNVNTDIGFSVEAVDWLQKSMGVPFSFEEAEDYAQASIRFGRWADVINAIGSMDYKAQQEPIWQYWLAKAYTQVGNNQQKQQARQLFTQLAQKNDYYGLLAKDQIGQTFTQLPNTPNPSNGDYNRLALDEHFNRAFVLYNLSASPSYTNREWNWAVKQARDRGDDAMIVAAAQTANNMGWYDRAIYAIKSTKTVPNTALAFPMPEKNTFVRYSRNFGIDPAWALGITRQESRFNVHAKSGVGAVGLMQIMPNTAKYAANKLGETYSASRASQADTNIRYGTFYLSDVIKKFGGQAVLATAGYNAGPNKAKTWQPEGGTLSADQYVESIPYPETRDYVKKVMENTANYGVLLGERQSLTQRMGTISAK